MLKISASHIYNSYAGLVNFDDHHVSTLSYNARKSLSFPRKWTHFLAAGYYFRNDMRIVSPLPASFNYKIVRKEKNVIDVS